METITIPKQEFVQMKRDLNTLRNNRLYRRLLEFKKNVKEKKYTRNDLKF